MACVCLCVCLCVRASVRLCTYTSGAWIYQYELTIVLVYLLAIV